MATLYNAILEIQSAPLDIFKAPDLSDLFMYESQFSDNATVDNGDVITIQCTDGIYRTGEIYSYGKTYVRIIVDGRFHTALKTDDVELNLRTAHNNFYYTVKAIEDAISEAA